MNAAKTIGAIGLCALLLVFMSGCVKGGDQEMPEERKAQISEHRLSPKRTASSSTSIWKH